MNTLVVYDSQYGNTERIAQAIADALRAFGQARAIRVDPSRPLDVPGVDMVIFGSPTQGWNATPAMRAFLQTLDPEQLRGVELACFDTRFNKPRWLTGSAAKRMHEAFERKGLALAAPPESFFVEGSEGPLQDGELERAATWARALANVGEAAHPDTP